MKCKAKQLHFLNADNNLACCYGIYFIVKLFTSKKYFYPSHKKLAYSCLQSFGTKATLHTIPTLQNNEQVPQVLKQVVNLSCYI